MLLPPANINISTSEILKSLILSAVYYFIYKRFILPNFMYVCFLCWLY